MHRIEQARDAFNEIYSKDLWGLHSNEWNRPKPGIESEETRWERLVRLIQDFILHNDVKSVVEFGCGTWTYAARVDWTGVRYDGFDVVESIIDGNIQRHAAENINFHVHTESTTLPEADLLFTKDVLHHLPTSDVLHYLSLFKKKYKYMIIANDVFPDDNLNGDTKHGGYRALRLERAPFNEPSAVLQRWEGLDFGIRWTKDFCLLFGAPDRSNADGIALPDSSAFQTPGTSDPSPSAAQSAAPRSSLLARIVSKLRD